jgi:hypothetical protein
MEYALTVLAGMLLANCVPHLVAGSQGMRFQTPFAKPSGVGESSPMINVWWGFANLAGGIALVEHAFAGWAWLASGALASFTFSAHHFGKVRRT